MRRYLLFSLLFISALLTLSAAVPEGLEGTVMDSFTEEPLKGVIIKGKGAFTSTDNNGRFEITPKAGTDSIHFRLIGYKSISLPINADFSKILMNPKATELNDVIVEAPDIFAKGDTLIFNVSQYANSRDNAIIDVIKRLPGINVEEDGTIKYQGKPINKFYLDGNDFIGGQYNLATNNISHKDVKSVEVMENHQPIKALEGIEFPEEAGINLKLKEDARSRWVGVVQAAAGIEPFLYNGSLFTMRMAPKIQNIFTLKADNTGWNPSNEISDHDFHQMFSSEYSPSLWPEYISADNSGAPLSEKRTRDNLSWIANAISAWKNGDTSMRLILNYIGDRLDNYSGLITDYLDSSIPVFNQRNNMRTQSHNLSAQLFSQTNKRYYYLKDKFTVECNHDGTNSSISGSFDLNQAVTKRYISVTNDLKLIKRNEKRIFSLDSRNTYQYQPERLSIFGEENILQTIGTSDFRSTTETKLGRMSRFWKFYVTCGIDLNYHKMKSALTGLEDFDNRGDVNSFLSSVYSTPQIDFERNGWRISLRTPLEWRYVSISGLHHYLNIAPSLTVRKQVTAKSELSASLSYRLNSPHPYLNIEITVLEDYRNLFMAYNPDKYSQDIVGSFSYKYRNPIKSLFFNLSSTFSHTRSSRLSNQIFIDDFIVTTYADKLHNTITWIVKGGLSKGLGHSRMVAGLETEVNFTSASSMRNYELIPYRNKGLQIKPYLRGSISKWLSINYEAEYNLSQLKVEEENTIYHTFHHNLFTNFTPIDKLTLSVGFEQFITRFPEGNISNLMLPDASAVWKINNKIRLTLTANNIFNKRIYEYINYGTLSRSEHFFRIRPRTILVSMQYRF